MEITVTELPAGRRVVFNHDPDARKITGPDAAEVLACLHYWDGMGMLYGTQPVRAPDPLGSTRDMAVFLASCFWDLPADLIALLPPAQEIPEGAVA